MIVCGLGLRGKCGNIERTYVGLPWSSSAALYHLAGLGHVFNPRVALEAIKRLEQCHVIDKRRIDDVPVETRRRKILRHRTTKRSGTRVALPRTVPAKHIRLYQKQASNV